VSLEILRRTPRGGARAAPLLFVHGAYAGAWCWDEHFLAYFAERGYDAHAVSLRGHAGSRTDIPLDALGMTDYVADVVEAASRLEARPVLIGHSMGANVVQRAARTVNARAMALLAPVPPQGLALSGWSLAARDPSLFGALAAVQLGGNGSPALPRLRDWLLSSSVTEKDAARYLRRMQRESQRALMDLAWPQHVWIAPSIGVPVLVIGARDDAFFPIAMVEESARFHGVAPIIVDDMAHVMMLEPEWRTAADRIAEWLDRRGL
jgi:pimeloyl-ACP methyl ester carboxylesterase